MACAPLPHSLSHLCLPVSSPVPRSFRLRQELEYAEKGASMESKSNQSAANNKPKDPHAVFVSFGLGELDDTNYDNQLSNWNGTIIGPQNVSSTLTAAHCAASLSPLPQRAVLTADCCCCRCFVRPTWASASTISASSAVPATPTSLPQCSSCRRSTCRAWTR